MESKPIFKPLLKYLSFRAVDSHSTTIILQNQVSPLVFMWPLFVYLWEQKVTGRQAEAGGKAENQSWAVVSQLVSLLTMRKCSGAPDVKTRSFVVPHVDTNEAGRKTATGLKELRFIPISIWKRNQLVLTRCKVTAQGGEPSTSWQHPSNTQVGAVLPLPTIYF